MSERRYRVAIIIDYITSEYSNLLLDGIKTACKEQNIELLIMPIGEIHNLQDSFGYQNLAVTGLLKNSNVDGIIFATGTQMHFATKPELSSYIKSYKTLPCVSISVEIPGIPSIVVESEKAYKELIEHLIKAQKCKKFGVMGVRSNSSEVRARTRIIKTTLEENGIDIKDVFFWKANFDYSSTMNELNVYYEESQSFDFDCIICLNDEMAFATIDFCKKHNLNIPDDVVITGFDDIDRDKLAIPTLSTINQRIYDQGYESAIIVKNMIDGITVPKKTVVDSLAILRQSTNRHNFNHKDNEFLAVDHNWEEENYGNYAATEWYQKKSQMFQINRFYSEMQYDMSQEQLRRRLNNDAKSFGVQALAIVLYDSPIEMSAPFDYFTVPKKAELFTAFDYVTGFDSNKQDEKIIFNPSKKILPDNILHFDGEGDYVLSLYHNTLQYGYIVLRRGDYDIAIYDLLSKIFSTIISSVHSFALVNNEHTKFQQEYNRLDIIANTDELTGLYNRRGLYELGQTTLKYAKAMNQVGLIVYSDMDGLKKINDVYGHEAGDRAILAESIIFKGNFRSNDIISRIGGDEFVMICPGLTKEAFERIRKQIDDDCRMWSETSHAQYVLSVSMGCIEYPNEKVGYQLTPLLSEADALLYMEKRRKKSRQNRKSN